LKKIAIAAAAAAIALTATVYAAPYYTLHQIKTALAERDASALSSHVDFPALRDSVKLQMNGAMADSIRAVGASDNPFAAMGQAVAGAMLGKIIDTMVTPAGVMAMVNQSALGQSGEAHAGKTQSTDAAPARPGYSAGYTAWDKFAIGSAVNAEGSGGALVLQRHGLWRWKLGAIELESGVRSAIATRPDQ